MIPVSASKPSLLMQRPQEGEFVRPYRRNQVWRGSMRQASRLLDTVSHLRRHERFKRTIRKSQLFWGLWISEKETTEWSCDSPRKQESLRTTHGLAHKFWRFALCLFLLTLPLMAANVNHETNWIPYLIIVEKVAEWTGSNALTYLLLLMLYILFSKTALISTLLESAKHFLEIE